MALDKIKEQLIEDERVDIFEQGFPKLQTLPTDPRFSTVLGFTGLEWNEYVVPYLQNNYPNETHPTERSKLIAFLETIFATAADLNINEIRNEIVVALGLDQIDIDPTEDDVVQMNPTALDWLVGYFVERIIRVVEDDTQIVNPSQVELLKAVGVAATNMNRTIDGEGLDDDEVLTQAVATVGMINTTEIPVWFGLMPVQMARMDIIQENSTDIDIFINSYKTKIEKLDLAIDTYSQKNAVSSLSLQDEVNYRQIIDAKNKLKQAFKKLLQDKLEVLTNRAGEVIDKNIVFDDPDEFESVINVVLVKPNNNLITALNKNLVSIIAEEFEGVKEWVTTYVNDFDDDPYWESHRYSDSRFEDVMQYETIAHDVWDNEPLDVDMFNFYRISIDGELDYKDNFYLELSNEISDKKEYIEEVKDFFNSGWVTNEVTVTQLELAIADAEANIKECEERIEHLEALQTWQEEITDEIVEQRAETQVNNFAQGYRELLQYSQGANPEAIEGERGFLEFQIFNTAKFGNRQMAVGILLEITSAAMENGKINFAKLEDLIKKNLFPDDKKVDPNQLKAAVFVVIEKVATDAGEVSAYQKRLLDGVPLGNVIVNPNIDTALSSGVIIKQPSKGVAATARNWFRNRNVNNEVKNAGMSEVLTAIDQYNQTESIPGEDEYFLWLGIENSVGLDINKPADVERVFGQYKRRLEIIDYIEANANLFPTQDIDFAEWREDVQDAMFAVITIMILEETPGESKKNELLRILSGEPIRTIRNYTEAEIDPRDANQLIIFLMTDIPSGFKQKLLENIPYFENALLIVLRKRQETIDALFETYVDVYDQAEIELDERTSLLHSAVFNGVLRGRYLRQVLNGLIPTANEIAGKLRLVIAPAEAKVVFISEKSPEVRTWLSFQTKYNSLDMQLKDKLDELSRAKARYMAVRDRFLQIGEGFEKDGYLEDAETVETPKELGAINRAMNQIINTNKVTILPTYPTKPMDTPAMSMASAPTQVGMPVVPPVDTVAQMPAVPADLAPVAVTPASPIPAANSGDAMFMRPAVPEPDLASLTNQVAAPENALATSVLNKNGFNEQGIQAVMAFISGMGYTASDFNWDKIEVSTNGGREFVVRPLPEATRVEYSGLRISVDTSNTVTITPISKQEATAITEPQLLDAAPSVETNQQLPFDPALPVSSQPTESKPVGTVPTTIPAVTVPGAQAVYPPKTVDSTAVTPPSTTVVSATDVGLPPLPDTYNSDNTLTKIEVPTPEKIAQSATAENPGDTLVNLPSVPADQPIPVVDTQTAMPTVNIPAVPNLDEKPDPEKPQDPIPPAEPPAAPPPSGGSPVTPTDVQPVVAENGVTTPSPIPPVGNLPTPLGTPPPIPPDPNASGYSGITEVAGAEDSQMRVMIEKRIQEISQLEPNEMYAQIEAEEKRLEHYYRDDLISAAVYRECSDALVIRDQKTQIEWRFNPNTDSWQREEQGVWVNDNPPADAEAEFEPVTVETVVDSSSAVSEVSTPVENIQDDAEKKEEPNFEKAGEILIKLMSNINVTVSPDDVTKLVAEGKVAFHENYGGYTFDLSTVETNPEWNGIRIPRLEEVTVALDFGTNAARLAYAEGKEMGNTLINVSGVRSINVYSTSIQASGTFSTPLSYKVLAKVFPNFPTDFENVDFQSDGEVVVSSILDKEKIFIANDGKEYEYNEARIGKDKVTLRRIPSGGVEPLTIDLSAPAVEVSPIEARTSAEGQQSETSSQSEILLTPDNIQQVINTHPLVGSSDWQKIANTFEDALTDTFAGNSKFKEEQLYRMAESIIVGSYQVVKGEIKALILTPREAAHKKSAEDFIIKFRTKTTQFKEAKALRNAAEILQEIPDIYPPAGYGKSIKFDAYYKYKDELDKRNIVPLSTDWVLKNITMDTFKKFNTNVGTGYWLAIATAFIELQRSDPNSPQLSILAAIIAQATTPETLIPKSYPEGQPQGLSALWQSAEVYLKNLYGNLGGNMFGGSAADIFGLGGSGDLFGSIFGAGGMGFNRPVEIKINEIASPAWFRQAQLFREELGKSPRNERLARQYAFAILGLKSGNKIDAKNTFRKLAKKYAPDVSKVTNAEAIFKELNEANTFLQDMKD